MNLKSSLLLISSAVLVPSVAQAGGFEYNSLGARALGRAGANGARFDDPLVLGVNPAALSLLPGTQLTLNANLAFFNACFDREGKYAGEPGTPDAERIIGNDVSRFGDLNAGTATYDFVDFPEVCNEGPPAPGLGLVFSMRPTDEIGIAAGILTPAAAGHLIYGDEDGIMNGPNGEIPSPAHYMLIEQQLLLLHPTIGIGYSPHRMVSFGAAFQWGMAMATFVNDVKGSPGEGPTSDFRSEFSASDFFVPGFIASVHVVPHDNIDVMAAFKWSDAIDGHGELDLNYGYYGDPGRAATSGIPTPTHVDGVGMKANQPARLQLGLRYADRIEPRDRGAGTSDSERVEDSLTTERWDVELDFVYEFNSAVDQFTLTIPNGSIAQTTESTGPDTEPTPSPLPLPTQVNLEHQWKDQWSLRLGGEYNVLPGMLAVRAGASYESSGIAKRYMTLDFWPTERIGIHAGATLRVAKWDFSLAYAHFIQETVTVPELNADGSRYANVPQVVATESCEGPGSEVCDYDGRIVNAGKYTSSFDVLSLGVNYHF